MLRDPDPERLRASAGDNLADLFRAMAQLPGSVLDEGTALSRHLAFPQNPMFKGAWSARLGGDGTDAVIEETIEWFRRRKAPFFFWWTGPGTRPDDLGARLTGHGLATMEEQQKLLASGIVPASAGAPVMVMDLTETDYDAARNPPKGFTIRRALDAAGLADFKQVFVATYQIPDWAGQAWVDATMAFTIKGAPWRIYVGYLGDKPVATNLVFEGTDTVSVYAIATLPEAQRRGIGAAITLLPLQQCRDRGYRFASLFATETAAPMYQRIGFADTGGRINRYLWRA